MKKAKKIENKIESCKIEWKYCREIFKTNFGVIKNL